MKLACHVVNSNVAIGSLPKLQISLGIVSLLEKIYDGEPILTVFSHMYNTVVSNKCMMLKVCRSPTQCRYSKQLFFANDRNRVRGAVLGLSQDGARTKSLKISASTA